MKLRQWNALTMAVALCGCFAPQHPPVSGRVEREQLTALAVDETYRLFIRLPPGYDADPARRFPLIVQLDANLPTFEEFELTAGLASGLEASGEIPESIVVGIGYATGEEARYERFRDLGLPLQDPEFKAAWTGLVPDGEAPKFFAFLKDELLPWVESRYRVAGPQGRALFGHSLGGLFVLYAVTRHERAGLFTGYVAASPSIFWDGGQFLEQWAQLTDPTQPAVLFTAAGQLEGPEMVVFFDEFIERTQAMPFSRLSIESRKVQTDHVGSAAPIFQDGLKHLFAQGLRGEP